MTDIWTPPNTSKAIHVFRFINILDDNTNVISPTKVNVWASTLAAIATVVASFIGWMTHQVGGLETMWGGTIGWLTHAYISHYHDKNQKAKYRLAQETQTLHKQELMKEEKV